MKHYRLGGEQSNNFLKALSFDFRDQPSKVKAKLMRKELK